MSHIIATPEALRALARETLRSRESAARILERSGYYPTESAVAFLRKERRELRAQTPSVTLINPLSQAEPMTIAVAADDTCLPADPAALVALIEQAADRMPDADDPGHEEECLMQARDAAMELHGVLCKADEDLQRACASGGPALVTPEQVRILVYALDCVACTALAYLRGERH